MRTIDSTPPNPVNPPPFPISDQVSAVLREYDAIRKQVDQGTTFMQGLIVPISIALAGTLIGWQGKIPPELAVLTVAPLITVVLVVAFQAYLWTEYSGLQLVAVEDRLFRIAGIALLTHETNLAIARRRVGVRFWLRTVIIAASAYLLLEIVLWRSLAGRAFVGVDEMLQDLFVCFLPVPVLYTAAIIVRLRRLRSGWSLTSLALFLDQGS
jgi:hypothetical protein